MKISKILFVVACLLGSPQLSAQMNLGIKGGLTRAWEDYGSLSVPDDAKIHVNGFNFSALAYHPIGEILSIGFEPGLVRRGAACIPGWNSGADPIFAGDSRLFLSYLEAPLMILAKKSVFEEKLELFGKLGYGHSYLITAIQEETDLASDEPPIRSKLKLDEVSNLNRWDHGFYGSLGMGIPVGTGQLFIESVYYLGLKDADRNNTSKNRSLNFNLGYMFKY